MDLASIITPVNVKVLHRLLVESNYDPLETKFLVDGFTSGFDIGYQGPMGRRDVSNNLPFKVGVGDRIDMWNKIMKEVEKKRYARPFDEIPFSDGFIQSPIGLVPKAGGQTRLIFHLSYDFNKTSGLGSVNFHTPVHLCSVKSRDIDFAVKSSFLWMNKSTKTVAYTKTDMKLAFRILPLSSSSYPWTVMKAVNPSLNKTQFFVDKCLLLGLVFLVLISRDFQML